MQKEGNVWEEIEKDRGFGQTDLWRDLFTG
jgi:hypothetical protein